MQHNTLYQLFSMVQADARVFDSIGTFLMIPDLFNFYLSGKKGCEFTNATTTQFYNVRTLTWDKDILQSMGIPPSIFPVIIPSGTILGNLALWLCRELEIKSVPVVAVATHDTASAFSAVPSTEKDFAFLSSGTWSLLGAEVPSPVINEIGLKYNFSNYGRACGTWGIWKNIQALWLLQECMRDWAGAGKNYSHEDIIRMANQAKPFGPILDSDDLTFFTPGDFPTRIVTYCQRTGQTPPEGEGAIVRCILESLALKYRYTFEQLQEVVDKRLNQLCVIGGGSRNWLLNQFTSEAIGIPLKAGPVEATAIGNIMQQLVALKEMDNLEDCRKVIQASFETDSFESSRSDAWEQAYGRYLEVIRKSKTFNQ
jgi:rhamnulokinase